MRQAIPLIVFILALAIMYLMLATSPSLSRDMQIPFVVFCILSIIILSSLGLFEESMINYVLYSTMIQFVYFLLGLGTAFLMGKSAWFAVLQLINFAIAGGLFAIITTLLYRTLKARRVRDYFGMYDSNQFLVTAIAISCLALGGLPGFNVFVWDYLVYSSLFSVHPALALGAVFAGLICFLFYFRICYVLFAGNVGIRVPLGITSRLAILLLSCTTILLGIIPHILFRILEGFA